MNHARLALTALLLAMPALRAAAAPDAAPPAKPKLVEGAPAPEVRLGEFLKGEPLRALDPEGTYVIEFWGVHCDPCVAEIPHLAALAKELGDKAVFLSVNAAEEDPVEVRAFVKRQGDKMGGRVALDKDGFMQTHWLNAAGNGGIPTAFVVVKGKIACITHPVNLDAALIAGLRDGTFTARDLAERRSQDAACGKEFRAAMRGPVNTDAKRRDAVAQLKKLAAKYPKAKYPAILIRHLEERLAKD